MKSKIFLLSMLAMLILSFKPNTETNDLKIIETPNISIIENTKNSIAIEELVDDRMCSIQIQITWVGTAEYGVLGYEGKRNTTRAYYEVNYGKSPLSIVIDDNTEIWTFFYPCFEDQKVNDLRARIEQDPDICEDGECED